MKKVFIPGTKLTHKEIDSSRRENKYFCGYLRAPHMYFGKFTGLCALCDFELCSHLHILSSLENNCPVYIDAVREMENEAKEELRKVYKKYSLK